MAFGVAGAVELAALAEGAVDGGAARARTFGLVGSDEDVGDGAVALSRGVCGSALLGLFELGSGASSVARVSALLCWHAVSASPSPNPQKQSAIAKRFTAVDA